MAADVFRFKPAEVPRASRGRRKSKYSATVEAVHQYLQKNPDQLSVKMELGAVDFKAAAAGFRKAIAQQYPDAMRLAQRGGELYILRK
jgi:hypothetical protein